MKLKTNGIQITGYGDYYPEKILTYEEIRGRLKYPEMHAAEKAVIGDIGVTKRHRANEKETSVFKQSTTIKHSGHYFFESLATSAKTCVAWLSGLTLL